MTDEPHRPITITVEQGSERLRFTTTRIPDGRVSIEAVGFTDDGEITTNLSGVLPAETMTTLGWLMLRSSTIGQDPVGFAQAQRRHPPTPTGPGAPRTTNPWPGASPRARPWPHSHRSSVATPVRSAPA